MQNTGINNFQRNLRHYIKRLEPESDPVALNAFAVYFYKH